MRRAMQSKLFAEDDFLDTFINQTKKYDTPGQNLDFKRSILYIELDIVYYTCRY